MHAPARSGAPRSSGFRVADGAKVVLTDAQSRVIVLLLFVISITVWLTPALMSQWAMLAAGAGFVVMISWRFIAAAWALRSRARDPRPAGGHATPPFSCAPAEPLPFYTVLVALYREANVARDLVCALSRLDYPCDRLEIILLTECDDVPTRLALESAGLPAHFRVLEVPPGCPRTKPRALNYGLAVARGEVLAIYDAEDRPDPAQLRAAVAALSREGARCVCAQAPLIIDHGQESWIARQFALEYQLHFGVLVPFLCQFKLPAPLGGTSNHFRTEVLRRLGGWDPWNVTEDADLGMRIAGAGFYTTFIAAPTNEEAPLTLRAFLRQRSRWIKGHIQTMLVVWRRPWSFLRAVGVAGALAAHLSLLGGVVSALVHAPLLLVGLGHLAFHGSSAWIGLIGVLGYLSVTALAASAPGVRPAHWRALLTTPFYWPLQTVAAIRALHELATRPHFWAKTDHGLARQRPAGGNAGAACASADRFHPPSLVQRAASPGLHP